MTSARSCGGDTTRCPITTGATTPTTAGTHPGSAPWTGYWGKQGPELLDRRLALYDGEQRMVFGANTFRLFTQMLAESTEDSEVRDPWVTAMWKLPAAG